MKHLRIGFTMADRSLQAVEVHPVKSIQMSELLSTADLNQRRFVSIVEVN